MEFLSAENTSGVPRGALPFCKSNSSSRRERDDTPSQALYLLSLSAPRANSTLTVSE